MSSLLGVIWAHIVTVACALAGDVSRATSFQSPPDNTWVCTVDWWMVASTSGDEGTYRYYRAERHSHAKYDQLISGKIEVVRWMSRFDPTSITALVVAALEDHKERLQAGWAIRNSLAIPGAWGRPEGDTLIWKHITVFSKPLPAFPEVDERH